MIDLTTVMPVLGHELRTPLAAILGYQELLSDGVLGEVNPKHAEPLLRIGSSAQQLLLLIDGLQELATGTPADDDEISEIDASALLKDIAARGAAFASSRSVGLTMTIPDGLTIVASESRITRIIETGLIAAAKPSAGRTVHGIVTADSTSLHVHITGSALDPVRDDPRASVSGSAAGTAAGLRLAMAGIAAQFAHGSIELLQAGDGIVLHITLPLVFTPHPD